METVCAVLLGLCANAGAGVVQVPADAPTIQAGIDLAVDGVDEVVVADGLYAGKANTNLDFAGKLIMVRSESGNPAACTIDCGGAGRGFHFHSGESAAAVVSGFTITGGDAEAGGGMLIEGASPTVINCRFVANTAPLGGGLYAGGGAPSVQGCVFLNNTAELGAGVYAIDAPASVASCVFSGNDATVNGGGLYTVGDSPAVSGCAFRHNSAVHGGGGLYNVSGSPSVTGCTFEENTAEAGGGMSTEQALALVSGCGFVGNAATVRGGALRGTSAELALSACIFRGNTADDGGAVHVGNGRVPGTILNCLFDGNTAAMRGGGVSAAIGVADAMVNCTFAANTAPAGSAMAADEFSPMTVQNSIVWGGGPSPIADPAGLALVSYSDVEGGWAGAGSNNLAADPMLDGDLRLLPGSPCIDAADNTAVPPGTTSDLAGGPRFLDDPAAPDTGNPDGANPIVDMGAYESAPGCPADCGDGDGSVGVIDLLALLAQWNQPGGGCDLGLGVPGASVEELLALLAAWGECP